MTTIDPEGVSVRLRCPVADAVYLLGEFNNWSTTATPMDRAAGGEWEARFPVGTRLGTYQFFVFKGGSPFGRLHATWKRAAPDEQPAATPGDQGGL